MGERIIGIMGAMHEEINSILHLMTGIEEISFGRRTYYTGTINTIKTVVVFSRWGKVAAATTVTSLITRFNITSLIFIGVAGAINTELKIGDVVIADRLVQHDMDARPLMPQHEIPLLGITYFEGDPDYITIAKKTIDAIIGDHIYSFIEEHEIERFLLRNTRVFTGTIASGDKFFADQADKEQLHAALPDIRCVEMEGAAVAQVCYEYEIPFVVLRIISDESNEHSSIDFPDFIKNVSSKYAYEIIRNMFALL
ncbi:adenosylhomocysteine nucleosidase [Mucilaginibacter lappiensis]|uniref:adenosylhomocysteine nucleosidase n=1 Tax=Mucilaginibacter lappiensis TaxID=354630 RepID=A0ABR6PNE5_9SPHI|nr:5'-methylthioadenosine/adenosylhomocysteine nucleosidase [Mucilaginibacter lappiensis]MBB6111296.1 adenosylhomocysteine nucleosidase [Mucilaginibacter lappiensis]SIR74906.1 adenosylhomocysteine nucleosidase [Mucilaginibacter lappiensis]